MIIRTQKDKNYSVICNMVLNDERLSWRARGIAAFLLTKPDEWNVNSEALSRQGVEGRDAVRNALRELEEAGYLVRERKQDEKGRWTTDVMLYEKPTPDNRRLESRTSVDQALLVSTVLVNTERISSHSTNEAHVTAKRGKAKGGIQEPLPYTPPPSAAAPPPLTVQQEWFGEVCGVVGWDYKTLSKASGGQVAQTVGILQKAGYTLEELRRFRVEIVPKDWRWRNGERPTIKQLREEIGRVKTVGSVAVIGQPELQEDTPEWLR